MTILDFDGKQYYILWVHEGSAPSHSRAFATRLGGVPFLNLQEIGAAQDGQWMFTKYVFADAEHLSLRMVDPQAFKDVIDNQGRVRRLLDRRRDDPSIFVSLGSCARAPGAK